MIKLSANCEIYKLWALHHRRLSLHGNLGNQASTLRKGQLVLLLQ